MLWITSLVSFFGNTLTAVAVPWFVLETTGSASKTGLTAAVTITPVVIATFFGGALVDRVSYRGLSVVADLLSAVTVAAVPFFYLTTGLSFSGLLVLMFLGAVLDAPGSTARQAMVPPLARLTGISIERINANFGMIRAASSLFAAPFAGLAIAWLGPINVLWFNAGTFIFSGFAVLVFIPVFARAAGSGESFMQDVRAGFDYVREHQLIRTMIFGALAINFLFAPLFGVAIPFLANQELQSVRALGVMLGGEGLGALVGAFLFGSFANRIPRRGFLLITLFLLSAPLFPLAFATTLPLATGLLVCIGLGSGLVNPMLMSFLQLSTPTAYMGRVMGLVGAGSMVAQPAGLLLGGLVIGLIGFRDSVLFIAVACMVVSILLALSRVIYQLDALPPEPPTQNDDLHLEHVPGIPAEERDLAKA